MNLFATGECSLFESLLYEKDVLWNKLDEDFFSLALRRLSSKRDSSGSRKGIKRGDIVKFCRYFVKQSNSQEGFSLFDGTCLIPLIPKRTHSYLKGSNEIEPLQIPEEFKVINEFPITYWESFFVYDNVTFNVFPFIKQIEKNMKYTLSGLKSSFVNDDEYIKNYILERLQVYLCNDLSLIVYDYCVDQYHVKFIFSEDVLDTLNINDNHDLLINYYKTGRSGIYLSVSVDSPEMRDDKEDYWEKYSDF